MRFLHTISSSQNCQMFVLVTCDLCTTTVIGCCSNRNAMVFAGKASPSFALLRCSNQGGCAPPSSFPRCHPGVREKNIYFYPATRQKHGGWGVKSADSLVNRTSKRAADAGRPSCHIGNHTHTETYTQTKTSLGAACFPPLCTDVFFTIPCITWTCPANC